MPSLARSPLVSTSILFSLAQPLISTRCSKRCKCAVLSDAPFIQHGPNLLWHDVSFFSFNSRASQDQYSPVSNSPASSARTALCPLPPRQSSSTWLELLPAKAVSTRQHTKRTAFLLLPISPELLPLSRRLGNDENASSASDLRRASGEAEVDRPLLLTSLRCKSENRTSEKRCRNRSGSWEGSLERTDPIREAINHPLDLSPFPNRPLLDQAVSPLLPIRLPLGTERRRNATSRQWSDRSTN